MALGAIVIVVAGILVFNYFRNRPAGESLPPATNEEATTPTTGKTYTVVAGDNLWKIAEAAYGSGYNWKDIAQENNIVNPDQIEVGQKLSIPQVASATPTVTQTTGNQAITAATYTVVRGDNLWNIAVRAYGDGYQWTKIANANKLVHPNLIHSGNVLILPR